MRNRSHEHQWTDAEDEQLRRLYSSSLTARQIGDLLGGLSKNSVIGRANRLGLGQRKPSADDRTATPPVAQIGELGRARGCQWIDGDPLQPGWSFCGERLKEGSRFSYCANHHKVVFRKAIPQGERQHFRFGGGR